jgi:fibronectin type 3 domain-containing protein
VSAASFTLPVEFGKERCFVLRAVAAAGTVTTESVPTAPVCVTPVDRFPPAAPTNLQAIQEGAAVTLVWSAVDAADLAGYIVLRGDGTGDNMQALVSDPVGSTSYRDQTVQPGATYVYAVSAQDRATPPNISPLSNRQTVIVR